MYKLSIKLKEHRSIESGYRENGRSDYIHEFRVYFTACIPDANAQRIEDEYALSLDSQLGEISPVTNPAISAPLIRSARSFRSERKIFSVTQIVVPVMDYLDVDTITSITSEHQREAV